MRHQRDDGLNTDGAGKPAKLVNGLIIRGMSLKNQFGAQVSVMNSVTANAVYRHRRVCKKVYLLLQKIGYGNDTKTA